MLLWLLACAPSGADVRCNYTADGLVGPAQGTYSAFRVRCEDYLQIGEVILREEEFVCAQDLRAQGATEVLCTCQAQPDSDCGPG